MSLDEVINAVHGVTNMALAHEIALDSNFKLEKFEPPQASLEKQVRYLVAKIIFFVKNFYKSKFCGLCISTLYLH